MLFSAPIPPVTVKQLVDVVAFPLLSGAGALAVILVLAGTDVIVKSARSAASKFLKLLGWLCLWPCKPDIP